MYEPVCWMYVFFKCHIVGPLHDHNDWPFGAVITRSVTILTYVCVTTYQPDTKSNPNHNPNPNPTTNQHTIVNIQLNIVSRRTYPDKFTRDKCCCTVCTTEL